MFHTVSDMGLEVKAWTLDALPFLYMTIKIVVPTSGTQKAMSTIIRMGKCCEVAYSIWVVKTLETIGRYANAH